MSEQPESTPSAAGEPRTAEQIFAGSNGIQRELDRTENMLLRLDQTGQSFVGRLLSAIHSLTTTTSSGVAGSATSSPATGGGYAPRAPSGQPIRTMGQAANAIGQRVGGMFSGGSGSGGGSGGSTPLGPALAGMGVKGVFSALNSYAKNTTPTILTMDKAAFNGVLNSGIGPGGYGASAQRAVSAIYGGQNQNLNVTASSAADAQGAAALLNYYSGQTMTTSTGGVNKAWFSAQSGLYAMGYANPFMSQTQVAQSLASVYAPRSIYAMRGLGYTTPVGAGGVQQDPRSIAQNVFSRTFQGRTSVSASTLAAALGQGGSLSANLAYLGSQAGWAPGTTTMLSTYLQQYNNAVNAGATPGQISTLMDKADRGDRGAQSQLARYGINATTVQGIKDLSATKTGRTADQYGPFNDSLQQSVSLLDDFNQALTSILNGTGANGMLGTLGGFASSFPGVVGGLGSFAGGATTGYLGGAGSGGLGGIAGMGANIATNLAGTAAAGAVWRNGAGWAGRGLGALRARLAGTGLTTAADGLPMLGAGGPALLRALGVTGLGLGVGYLGNKASQSLSGAGPGSSTGSELLRTGGTTASDALAGAAIGSVIPGVGTAVGGFVGGLWGLGQSLWDWHKDTQNTSATTVNNTASSVPAARLGSPFSNPLTTTYGLGSGSSTATDTGGRPSGVTPALGSGAASATAAARAVAHAVAQVGKPYQWGATGPDSYDCSGLTQSSYAAAGVKIPRTSQEQMAIGTPVKQGSEVAGDLMLPEPGHVTMCIGGGKLVEAPHTGANVRIRTYSPKEFPTIRRVVAGAGDATGQNAAATGGNGASGASVAATPHLVGPNGSISELNALNGALAERYSPPVASQKTVAAGQDLTGAMLGANLGPSNLNGTVKDVYGHTYKVPTGPKPTGSVSSWISTALAIAGLPASDASDLGIIVQGESGGDPWSINLTDSNAQAGHPSKGLGQDIDSTFNAHAMAGHTNIWNPVDNLIASARYGIERYGSLDNVPGVKAVKSGRQYVGYKVGTWSVPEDGPAYLHKDEMVWPATTANTIRNQLLKDSLYSPNAQGAATAQHSGANVHLNFGAGSVQVTIPGATAQAANAAAEQFVTGILNDPRIKAMAVGL